MTKPLETKPCPECEKYIPVSAVRCRCGWTAPQGKSDYVACAFAGCPNCAMVRIRTKTGWANVCVDHDKTVVQLRADARCKAMGLDTPAKQREWVLQHLKIKPLKDKILMPEVEDVGIDREAESIPF